MMIAADDLRLMPISLRKDLIAAGHSDRSLALALRDGTLERPRRGAYVDGASWRRLSEEQRYAVRAHAAFRQAKTDVALSHSAAVPFLDGRLWGVDLRELHLTRLDEKTGRRDAGVRQHCGKLLDGDIITDHGLTITSPTRAALEVTTITTTEVSLCIVNDLLHRGLTTHDALRERYAGPMERWPHSLRTDLVLRLADPRIASIGESRTSYALWGQNVPKPEPQFEVYDAGGVLVARLDFALPDHGIWLEFDGRAKYHQHRRAGESVEAMVLREKRREELVSELTGWRCLRITWADLEDPVRLALRIRALIDSVAAARARSLAS